MDWEDITRALPYLLLVLLMVFLYGFARGYTDATIGNVLSIDVRVNNTGNLYAVRLSGLPLRNSPATLEIYDNSTTYARWSGVVSSGDVVTVSGRPAGKVAVLRITLAPPPDALGSGNPFFVGVGRWAWGAVHYYVVTLRFEECGAGVCSSASVGSVDAFRYALLSGATTLLLFALGLAVIFAVVAAYALVRGMAGYVREKVSGALEWWRDLLEG